MFPHVSSEIDPDSSYESRTGTKAETMPVRGVLIHDARPESRAHVERIVAECGATPLRAGDDETILAAAEAASAIEQRGQLALVALDPCPAPDAPVLGLIRALKGRGARVVCYGEGAQAWPVGKRCEPLLAGALAVFDSARAEFAGELKSALVRLLRAESSRHDAETRLKREMARHGLVGESAAMMSVFRWAMRAGALSDLPVLITGETGTGKELLVNALFQLDEKRRRGPLIAVNCSAVSAGLAESELFGHRRGAFTGAERDRKGLVRAADGGVLFLDEIGDLDASLQAKLLRVLQEMRVLGVGEEREVGVDVRVIAATNRNLEELVRQGKFRADLFHRLNILSVNLPPLRQRPEDLRPLVEHFLTKNRALRASGHSGVAHEFVEALAQLRLPGNARQLENLVRRALVAKDSDAPLNLSDLPAEIWQELSERVETPGASAARRAETPRDDAAPYDATQRDETPHETAAQGDAATQHDASPPAHALPPDLHAHLISLLDINHWNLSDTLAHCEKLLVASALQHTGGNQTQTARLLGITPRSVYNKVRKHQLH